MPERRQKGPMLAATLELDGGVALAGQLSLDQGAELELSSARLTGGAAAGGKVSLRGGSPGAVKLEQNNAVAIPVTLKRVKGRSVFVCLEAPQSPPSRKLLADLAPRTGASDLGDLQGVTVRYTGLLQELASLGLGQLRPRLATFTAELRLQLLEQVARAENKQQRAELETTVDLVRRNGPEIVSAIIDRLVAFFRDPTPEAFDVREEHSRPTEEAVLGLVDLNEFEHGLALERLIRVGSELYDLDLECLTLRQAELIDTDPRALRLPFHIRQLCTALHESLQLQGIPASANSLILDFFDHEVLRKLDTFYAELNQLLRNEGLLPGLEEKIEKHGSQLNKPGPIRRTPSRPRPQAQQAPAPAPSPPPRPTSLEHTVPFGDQGHLATAGAQGDYADKLYGSLMNAVCVGREPELAATGTEAAAPPPGARLASMHQVADVLRQLQADPGVRRAVQQCHSLRDYLVENRGHISGLDDSDGLASDTLNQLDVVDNLFNTIHKQLEAGAEVHPAIADLQIPLARLALQEPRFLLNRDHPARAVVDKIAELAATASLPNKALESRVSRVVEKIISNYDTDPAVFEQASSDIDTLLEQQRRTMTRNIERVIRTQEGQEKLQAARRAVGAAIDDALPKPEAPQAILDLVEHGWRDLLVLTYVKSGPDSQEWQNQLASLRTLSQWLVEQKTGDLPVPEQARRYSEASRLLQEIDTNLATNLPTHFAYRASLKQMTDMLAGDGEITLRQRQPGPDSDTAGAERRARIEDLPRLRRWIKRVEELQAGNWLSYRDKEGQAQRMQLAWISPEKDRFIFVNERGQKNADLSAVQLARQLSRGVKPPSPSDDLGVVDRSVYDTLENLQKTLSFERNHDTLTRLINRKTFVEQVNRALSHARSKKSEHAVLYLDIDQFRLVNDLYDRVNGDQVLLEFGKLLSQLHGRKISSARIEGDEFAVLLLDKSMEEAQALADKVRQDIESSSVSIDAEPVSFTVSVGVAPVVEHSPEVEEILGQARSATDLAKAQGRNQVAPYTEDQTRVREFRKERARTRQDLEQALQTDRFVLRAQPIVQSAINGHDTVSRYELLLGWRGHDGELTSPEAFIRSAERYGFMTLVDRWVVKEAFSWISRLMDEQKVVPHLAINLSGVSITSDDFMEYLFDQISEFGVGTNRICFEITEAGTISNMVKAADFVRAFRNIGCKFSIDDFGTGLSSHEFLRELPVDYVKIDGAFIKDIHSNRNDFAMARSINDLAHFLGQKTIAESVENEKIVDCLREIGVDYLQGWGVGKPQLLSAIARDLSTIEK